MNAFNFFFFNMLSQCLVTPITEKVISYLLVLRQQLYIAVEIQFFLIYFKILRIFSIEIISIVMLKNINNKKRIGIIFDLTAYSLEKV